MDGVRRCCCYRPAYPSAVHVDVPAPLHVAIGNNALDVTLALYTVEMLPELKQRDIPDGTADAEGGDHFTTAARQIL